MNLSDFDVQLEFTLEQIAPEKYHDKWKTLAKTLRIADITTEDINNLLLSVKNYCVMETNKNLDILDRGEGGLGGNSNANDKQLRFYVDLNVVKNMNSCVDDVIINVFNSDNGKSRWTLSELSDLVNAFSKTFSDYMTEDNCVKGKIILTNKLNFDDID